MTLRTSLLIAGLIASGMAGCSKFYTYKGPEVTRVEIFKASRQMYLFHGDKVLESYEIELGFAPEGNKFVEGDGKTPEGEYFIDRRNPNSSYYLSVGISYPNEEDIAEAKALGQSPGGDIFIHGQKSWNNRGGDDWTAGCIAVTNKEVRDIYAMVRTGTPITIHP